MSDIYRYWDLKDELYAVMEEMFSGGNGSSSSYEELIARRDAINSELMELEQMIMNTLDMDDPDPIDEDLDYEDYDDY